jgi:hypothetical protein
MAHLADDAMLAILIALGLGMVAVIYIIYKVGGGITSGLSTLSGWGGDILNAPQNILSDIWTGAQNVWADVSGTAGPGQSYDATGVSGSY